MSTGRMLSGLPCNLTLAVLICFLSAVAVTYGQFVDSTELGEEESLYDPLMLREEDLAASAPIPSYRTMQPFKRNWNQLNSMWGKRSGFANGHGTFHRKRDGREQGWNNLRSMWGKRSDGSSQSSSRPSWIQLRGMWGKRSKAPGPPAVPRTVVLDDSGKATNRYVCILTVRRFSK